MTESGEGKVKATRLRDGMKEKVKEEEKRKGKWWRQRSAVASQA